MATPTYLMKRNGVYYIRLPIPAHLQTDLKKKEIWKSLGVSKFQDACAIMRLALLSNGSVDSTIVEQAKPLHEKLSHLYELKRRIPTSEKLPKLVHNKLPQLTFGELIKKYNESVETKDKSKENKTKHATYQSLLIEILEEQTNIVDINRELVRRKLRHALDVLPSRFRTKPAYKAGYY
jgi:hypothetical protein